MSTCIVSVIPEEHRALIATDTALTSLGRREYSEVAKLDVLPHAGAVMAGAGALVVFQAACRWARRPAVGAGFDLFARTLRGALDEILASEMEYWKNDQPTLDLLAQGSAVHLVGWSARVMRMRALVFIQDPGTTKFLECDTGGRYAHPLDPETSHPQPRTVDEIAARAVAAVHYGRSVNRAAAYGQRLTIAEITRDTITAHTRPCPAT